MPRPKYCRKVGCVPDANYFKPRGIPASLLGEVVLALDEFEAIRLADLDGLYQEGAAKKMNVSRQTFGRIIETAHGKIADALINGKALKIEGGDVSIEEMERIRCPRCKRVYGPAPLSGVALACPHCNKQLIMNKNQTELEEKNMKIALPSFQNQVDAHFGHCEYFTVFTADEKNLIVKEEKITPPAGCGCKSNIVHTLSQMGVKIMLAGNMGAGAVDVLNSHGIEVLRGCSGDVKKVTEQWLSGTLHDSGIACLAHEHACHED
jgi:predicted DNA-binding protein (UPF0251 family)/predicted Fe-Mo cluster-binding NifX family protein